jgi:hypothetical protein
VRNCGYPVEELLIISDSKLSGAAIRTFGNLVISSGQSGIILKLL